jgi:transcriptional regulator with XRE-family HTH domain
VAARSDRRATAFPALAPTGTALQGPFDRSITSEVVAAGWIAPYRATVSTTLVAGGLLRDWRRRRRMSQLDLALRAGVSARHLSFVETGRSQPSRTVLLSLADALQVPMREQNVLLLAAGYAPAFGERRFEDPEMDAAAEAIRAVLRGHEPYPAHAIDRHWNLVLANEAFGVLLEGVSEELLSPPINVLRMGLHPRGLAPRIVNLDQIHRHVLDRLHRQVELTADQTLSDLYEELRDYRLPRPATHRPAARQSGVVIPLILQSSAGQLTLMTTTMVFGTPNDVSLEELAVEAFFPADPVTAERLTELSQREGRRAFRPAAPASTRTSRAAS